MIMFTLWVFNIAMENGPFINEFPTKTTIYRGFSLAMLNNQMVVGKPSIWGLIILSHSQLADKVENKKLVADLKHLKLYMITG